MLIKTFAVQKEESKIKNKNAQKAKTVLSSPVRAADQLFSMTDS